MLFDPQQYAPSVARLLIEDRLPELGRGRENSAALADLRSLTSESLAARHGLRDPHMLDACRAGLWLWHDYLDESHSISQEIETTTGSFWHGIMHRREGDFGNAKYWFRRVGKHPVFGELAQAAQAEVLESGDSKPARGAAGDWLIAGPAWDSLAFVDLCEATIAGQGIDERLCRRIARAEWQLLFHYCYVRGTGMGDSTDRD